MKMLITTILSFGLAIWALPIMSATPAEICAEIQLQTGIIPDSCDPSRFENPAPARAKRAVEQKSVKVNRIDLLPLAIQESHVFFVGGGSKLDADSREKIAVLKEIFNTSVLRSGCFKLVGHSDASGPPGPNMKIAQARAEAVANALRSNLADSSRIEQITAMGEDELLNDVSPNSPLNRRVTIYARACQQP